MSAAMQTGNTAAKLQMEAGIYAEVKSQEGKPSLPRDSSGSTTSLSSASPRRSTSPPKAASSTSHDSDSVAAATGAFSTSVKAAAKAKIVEVEAEAVVSAKAVVEVEVETEAERAVALEAAMSRFAGVMPCDLPAGTSLIYCRGTAEKPSIEPAACRSLGASWSSVGPSGWEEEQALSDQALERCSFAVVVCDPFCEAEVEVAKRLLLWLDTKEVAPPVALLPLRIRRPRPSMAPVDRLRSVLEAWVHDMIVVESSGFELALQIRASFARVQAQSNSVMDQFRERAAQAEKLRTLKAEVNMTLWQYVPPRFGLTLPAVNHNLGDEDGTHIAGYTVAKRLGRGAFGQVFELQPPAGVQGEPGGEVVKVISKTMIRSARDLRQLQRIWQIMRLLSGRWRHPNIARSYQMYNSPTHIYIRMENAGQQNLYQRLRARDAGMRPFPLEHLHSIAKQVAAAVGHLHSGPKVCHRDVKPENVLLAEDPENEGRIVAKLVDFDTAMVQMDRSQCRATCGTFPFMAPEVAGKEYDGMAADMWSVGLVLLESATSTRIVERHLAEAYPEEHEEGEQPDAPPRGCPHRAVARLRVAFAAGELVRKLFRKNRTAEVAPLAAMYEEVVSNLCHILPKARWTAPQLIQKLGEVTLDNEGYSAPAATVVATTGAAAGAGDAA